MPGNILLRHFLSRRVVLVAPIRPSSILCKAQRLHPAPFVQRSSFSTHTAFEMTPSNEDTKQEKKSYHTKATGAALATAKKRSKEHNLKLYGSCFW
jgi:hypothetical protein